MKLLYFKLWLPTTTTNSYFSGQTSHLTYLKSALQPSLSTVQNTVAKLIFFLPHLFCLYNLQFTFSSGIKSQLLFCTRKSSITWPSLSLANVSLHFFRFWTLHNDTAGITCNLTYICLGLYAHIWECLWTGGFTLYHVAVPTVYFPPDNCSYQRKQILCFQLSHPFSGPNLSNLCCVQVPQKQLLFSQPVSFSVLFSWVCFKQGRLRI